MRVESKKYLYDIQQAAEAIAGFAAGRTFEDYESDGMLRSAIERQFEIVGEAMGQLARVEPAVAERIDEYHHIIAFRNVLVHRYAQVDNRLVSDIVQSRLPSLRGQVDALLGES